ncbi:hypothetical protein ACIA5D_21650 [Actinoplanes sp. NPDC051513]|uniref:hypothetical protein n=1 Tax=Actinoplanes sp. NPDC051513 TaxID=3363908 RepID=UPI0037BC030D
MAGPILVSALLVAAVLSSLADKAESSAQGACGSRPATVTAIREDPVLNQRPAAVRLSAPISAFSCATSPDSGHRAGPS